MSRAATFGIVGGYGAAGRMVASELVKSGAGQILVGGRDLAKGQALASEFDGRVSAARLDVLDNASLDDFCRHCSIIVNCAGPVLALQDRAAQAALRARCHYVDAAGMSLVKEGMLPHNREIQDWGLSFVISAGWNPGLSELVPVYADARARSKLDAIESLSVYQSDSGEWSTNALRDAVHFVRSSGLQPPGYFRQGEWTRIKMSEASRRVDLGEPVGAGRFSLISTPELSEVGRGLKDCDVSTYTYLSGFRTVAAVTLMALLPLPQALSVRWFSNIFRRNRLPVDGFVVARVLGSCQGSKLAFTAQIVYRDRRDYWIHGLALATTARMIFEGKAKAGVHFLAEAVDPIAFMAELQKAGVELLENLDADRS
jgi:saccharopine dehydrogenase-like NADP-dependent oxidoreductase